MAEKTCVMCDRPRSQCICTDSDYEQARFIEEMEEYKEQEHKERGHVMTPTPEEKNEIAELAFINNRSFFLREDQKILVRLWEIIQGAVSYHDYDTVNEITPGMVANDEIFTIGNHTILCTEFSASDLEIISEDPEIAHIIAAFNALRGRLDLIYHDHDHYDRVITEANAKKEAASLGDLDDHPF